MNPRFPGELRWPILQDFFVGTGNISQPVIFVSLIYSLLAVKAYLVTSAKPAWMLLPCWFRIYTVHREDRVVGAQNLLCQRQIPFSILQRKSFNQNHSIIIRNYILGMHREASPSTLELFRVVTIFCQQLKFHNDGFSSARSPAASRCFSGI